MEPRTCSGFTLIELMIALGLSSIVAVGVYKLLRSQAQSAGDQASTSQNLRSAQRVRVLMSDDLAQAGFDPRFIDLHRTALTPLTAASNDSFTIQGDFNLSGTVGDQTESQDPETITYQFDASANRVTRNGNPVLANVQSFSVTYYDANGVSATSVPGPAIGALSAIKKVRVQWSQSARDMAPRNDELIVTLRNHK